MKIIVFYVFKPTKELQELTAAAGHSYLAQPSVWMANEHDRVGADYSREEISDAHWMQFFANLFGDDSESTELTNLRHKCQALGSSGCWSVTEAKMGGDAKDLIEEGQLAKAFLTERNAL